MGPPLRLAFLELRPNGPGGLAEHRDDVQLNGPNLVIFLGDASRRNPGVQKLPSLDFLCQRIGESELLFHHEIAYLRRLPKFGIQRVMDLAQHQPLLLGTN